MAKSKGRAQQKKTQRGRARQDAPRDYWHKKSKPLTLAREQFRVRVKRGDKKDVVVLDNEVMSIEWDDAGGPPTGTLAFTQGSRPSGIEVGHLCILEWAPLSGGQWYEVWRMRVTEPDANPMTGEVSVTLEDDITYLHRSKDTFRYGKSKKHPNGIKLETIIRDICRRYGVRAGRLARMTTRTKRFVVHGSPADALVKCLLLERNNTGKRLVLRSRAGKLDIVPLTRSRTLLEIGPAIIDASVKQSLSRYASSITVRGSITGKKDRDDKGHKKRKLFIKVTSRASQRRFGYVHINATAPKGVDTIGEARRWARRELAKRLRPKNEITLSHVGIPTVKRWDALQLYIPEENVDMLCYVSEVRHFLTPGDYHMEIVVRFTDPFVDKRGERIRKKKCEAAAKRNRPHPRSCNEELRRTTRQRPKTARQRRDARAKAST